MKKVVDLELLKQEAFELAKLKTPLLVLLKGEVGAGKTQFVKFFLEGLDFFKVKSPTYSFHEVYQWTDAKGIVRQVDHLDLYRIKNEQDAESIGLWDLLSQPNDKVVLIEWFDVVSQSNWNSMNLWNRVEVKLNHVDKTTRELEIIINVRN